MSAERISNQKRKSSIHDIRMKSRNYRESQVSDDIETDYSDINMEFSDVPDAHIWSNLIQESLTDSEDNRIEFELSDVIDADELGFGFDVHAYINTLNFSLRKWAIRNNITLLALSELLKILKARGHRTLPSDARTLLETPKTVETTKMGFGRYWYGGLKKKLAEVCRKSSANPLKLTFHIDGTPIYKSSKSEFWPIQCNVTDVDMKPFFVAIYKGASKPPSAEIFMRPLLNEIQELLSGGMLVAVNGVTVSRNVKIDKFILDAPARAFLKCIIGHSGYYSCERCEERGEYLRKTSRGANSKGKKSGHVCLVGTNALLRTDETFRNQENEQHHLDNSPLEELPIDMVRDIPLEYLHLILYGGMKRLLLLWINGTKNFKLPEKDVIEISKKHVQAGLTKPTEINRQNRSLKCISYWKATEFRTFLLKTGPVVFQNHLPIEMYNHFLALHCAVTICCNEQLLKYLPVAKMLFRSFTEGFGEIYGDENSTYSTHSIIHVTDDVERFGVFDKYSAFPGESNLGFLKNLVRGGNLPLQQVVKRLAERDSCDKVRQFEESEVAERDGLHKGILRLNQMRLDCSEKNQWILTKSLDIFKITSIREHENISISGQMLLRENIEDLYALPIASKQLFIYQSSLDSFNCDINVNDVFCKLYRIKVCSEKSAFFPLCHSIMQ